MNILLISGEISSDRYAACLAVELKRQNPTVRIYGIGGPELQKTADVFLENLSDQNVYGAWETFKQKKPFEAFLARLRTAADTIGFEKTVLLDFSQHNFKVAGQLKGKTRILTYITPNFWILKDRKKAKKLMAYSDAIITIYRPEYEFYQSLDAKNLHYFGHPLVTLFPPCMPKPIGDPIKVGIFPGSRPQEIRYLLPPICETIRALIQTPHRFRFFISLSAPAFKSHIIRILEKHKLPEIELVETGSADVLKAADVLITKSGTITLEAALAYKPLVVLAALAPLSYFIAKKLLRLDIPYVSLPNILLQKPVVPEFIQRQIVPKTIAKTLLTLCQPSPEREAQQAAFRHLHSQLTPPEARPFIQAAQVILNR